MNVSGHFKYDAHLTHMTVANVKTKRTKKKEKSRKRSVVYLKRDFFGRPSLLRIKIEVERGEFNEDEKQQHTCQNERLKIKETFMLEIEMHASGFV